MLLCCACLPVPGLAQESAPSANAKAQTDVFLFIHPSSPSTTTVGLSYRKRIPHAQVQSEIKRLLAVSGWKLSGEPEITDESARPDDPKRFPPVTGAKFALVDAPQFHDNAPELASYLKAFQTWDYLDVMFVTTDLVPYNGVTNFQNPALDVTLEKSEGIYDYRVAIREHSKDLPPLLPTAPTTSANPRDKTASSPSTAPSSTVGVVETTPYSPSLIWPYLLIVIGALLVGGVVLYLYVKRHQDSLKPGRSR